MTGLIEFYQHFNLHTAAAILHSIKNIYFKHIFSLLSECEKVIHVYIVIGGELLLCSSLFPEFFVLSILQCIPFFSFLQITFFFLKKN